MAKAAWARVAAASGQVRGSRPLVEKPACGFAASPHGKVASGWDKGIWGRGHRGAWLPAWLKDSFQSSFRMRLSDDGSVWVTRSGQYQIELE